MSSSNGQAIRIVRSYIREAVQSKYVAANLALIRKRSSQISCPCTTRLQRGNIPRHIDTNWIRSYILHGIT
jgi:hypothetical protein